jgi:hypothetical protein
VKRICHGDLGAAKSKEAFLALLWCQTNAKILCRLPDSEQVLGDARHPFPQSTRARARGLAADAAKFIQALSEAAAQGHVAAQ